MNSSMHITPSTVTDPLVSKIRHLFEKKIRYNHDQTTASFSSGAEAIKTPLLVGARWQIRRATGCGWNSAVVLTNEASSVLERQLNARARARSG